MSASLAILAAVVSVNFNSEIGKLRPELHSSGFGPLVCSCPKERVDEIGTMGFKAARTHDWALINPGERVCDYYHIFPLMHLDAKDPKNYVFGPTDYLLRRTREEAGLDVFFRLGTSIEHSGPNIHFNTLIPEDFDKVAEIFAATVRHYNRGWANGFEWGIKYWEIWNEPDGVNNMWCLPDGDAGVGETDAAREADYKARDAKRRELFVKFFVTVLKRLKTEFPDIKVGGPALCTLNEEYVRALLDACRKAGVAPDFISWHHYTRNPGRIMGAIDLARKLCDEYGFRNCELVINEWHFFGEYSWGELRTNDPAIHRRVWSGPGAHNGIDSSCFNLTMLSLFQTSKLDQAYYYGCRHIGSWGYMDEDRNKYKVYYGLKMFGDFLKRFQVICASKSDNGVTVLAAKSADGRRKGFLVTDYRSGATEIVVNVEGVGPGCDPAVWVHDFTRDFEPMPVRLFDGRLVLKKADDHSVAFAVWF